MEILVYLLLGLLIITIELKRERYFYFDLLTFFHFFYFLVYVFTPIALIIGGPHLINDDMPFGIFYYHKCAYTPYVILGAYLFFLAGFYWQKPHYFAKRFEIRFPAFTLYDLLKILPFAFAFLYAVLFLYTSEFGGIIEAIRQAEAYRSSAIAFKKFAFVKYFFPLNDILLYTLFYLLYLKKEACCRKWFLFYFFLSILFVSLKFALNNSRGDLLFTLGGFYVIAAIYHRRFFWKFVWITTLLTIFVLKFADPLFGAVAIWIRDGFEAFWNAFITELKIQNAHGSSIISNFTHAIVSLDTSLQSAGYNYPFRYLKDFVNGITSLVPGQLFGSSSSDLTLMEQNTILLSGVRKEIVLPGILGFLGYAFHAVGIFVGMFVYGTIGAILSEWFSILYRKYPISLPILYLYISSYGYFVFRGTIIYAIHDNFMLFVVSAILLYFAKIYYRPDPHVKYYSKNVDLI
ncbi:MAG: hypothetical protein B6D59_06425 [Campylobacteraceae bacterium 4484_4]|nr:MAG: hypothetical protein B6D59_06425 [Campylobacteraceae bacterium 4484_4]